MAPVSENLYGSASGPRATFPRNFAAVEAERYVRKPEALDNRAYENRMENGPKASGGGNRWKSRGLVQMAGRDNYAKYGIENTPDSALEPAIAVLIMFDEKSGQVHWQEPVTLFQCECDRSGWCS